MLKKKWEKKKQKGRKDIETKDYDDVMIKRSRSSELMSLCRIVCKRKNNRKEIYV